MNMHCTPMRTRRIENSIKNDAERNKRRETTNIYNTIENKSIIQIQKLSKQLKNKRHTAAKVVVYRLLHWHFPASRQSALLTLIWHVSQLAARPNTCSPDNMLREFGIFAGSDVGISTSKHRLLVAARLYEWQTWQTSRWSDEIRKQLWAINANISTTTFVRMRIYSQWTRCIRLFVSVSVSVSVSSGPAKWSAGSVVFTREWL